MHASPQRLHIEEPGPLPSLRAVPAEPKLKPRMLRILRLLRVAFWRAFVHDSFATAKASAYSSIPLPRLPLPPPFPSFLFFFCFVFCRAPPPEIWRKGGPYLREISYALS